MRTLTLPPAEQRSKAGAPRVRSFAARACLFATLPLLALTTSNVQAQQATRFGDGVLDISTQLPQEIRAGEQFTYEITVSNATDNLTLHDVRLQQSQAQGFTIESTSIKGQSAANKGNPSNANNNREDSDVRKELFEDPKSENQQSNRSNASKNQMSASSSGNNSHTFKIDELAPGQSQTITVKAAADEEGRLETCLQIMSYRPAICLTSNVVKPKLEIVKTAPKQANRCEEIVLEYSVTNSGSGDLGQFQVMDQLGNNLMTIEGNNELNFPVDGLKAGETRRFQARVFATKPGEVSSRAVAKAENAELRARSKQTTTNVIAPDLRVNVEGPGTIYNNQNATFTATITNSGNATAEDVQIALMWPQSASLADLGEVRMRNSSKQDDNQAQGANEASSQNRSNEQPTPAEVTADGQKNQSGKGNAAANSNDSDNDNAETQMASDAFSITALEPGQSAVFQYVVQPRGMDQINTKVQASFNCVVDSADDQEQAQAETMATATAQANIKRFAALQIYAVDSTDPVQQGNDVTYIIRVLNEGQKADTNVAVTANLPDQLKLKSADGPTEHQVSGTEVTFEPIESLAPGDEVEYRLITTSNGSGNIQFKAELQSDALSGSVTAEEPTRLFGEDNSTR